MELLVDISAIIVSAPHEEHLGRHIFRMLRENNILALEHDYLFGQVPFFDNYFKSIPGAVYIVPLTATTLNSSPLRSIVEYLNEKQKKVVFMSIDGTIPEKSLTTSLTEIEYLNESNGSVSDMLTRHVREAIMALPAALGKAGPGSDPQALMNVVAKTVSDSNSQPKAAIGPENPVVEPEKNITATTESVSDPVTVPEKPLMPQPTESTGEPEPFARFVISNPSGDDSDDKVGFIQKIGKKGLIIIASVAIAVIAIIFISKNKYEIKEFLRSFSAADTEEPMYAVDTALSVTEDVAEPVAEESEMVEQVAYEPFPYEVAYLSGNFFNSPVHVLLDLERNVGALYFVDNPDRGYVLFSIQSYYRDIDGHIAFKDMTGDENSRGIFVGILDLNGFHGTFQTPRDENHPTTPVELTPINPEDTTFPDLPALRQMLDKTISDSSQAEEEYVEEY